MNTGIHTCMDVRHLTCIFVRYLNACGIVQMQQRESLNVSKLGVHDHVCCLCTALYSEKVRSTCLERGEKISCSHEILRFNGVRVFQYVLYLQA